MSSYDEKRAVADVDSDRLSNENDVAQIEDDIVNNINNGEISEIVVVAEGEERTTWFVWMLVLCSSISGLLFGAYLCLHFEVFAHSYLFRLRYRGHFRRTSVYWI